MNKLLLIVTLGIAAYVGVFHGPGRSGQMDSIAGAERVSASATQPESALEHAYVNRLNNQQLAGEGTVIKVLPDDTRGSRHQRFILRLETGRTLLVAHNIDLAPRIENVQPGDTLAFFGEYEWNAKGGVMHWTHHDPQGRHIGGWLRHGGRTYQ